MPSSLVLVSTLLLIAFRGVSSKVLQVNAKGAMMCVFDDSMRVVVELCEQNVICKFADTCVASTSTEFDGQFSLYGEVSDWVLNDRIQTSPILFSYLIRLLTSKSIRHVRR
ncbi:unnamed protein product [Caenorhabditis bovis]|uniref:Uncharacterized protein n=1 Tax=Caenorhabditis bovis TaxID=2654633 RepID=A0A8S1F679_9PELO|nr:unnamed protein product [Caenorhabditis bovis]